MRNVRVSEKAFAIQTKINALYTVPNLAVANIPKLILPLIVSLTYHASAATHHLSAHRQLIIIATRRHHQKLSILAILGNLSLPTSAMVFTKPANSRPISPSLSIIPSTSSTLDLSPPTPLLLNLGRLSSSRIRYHRHCKPWMLRGV